MTLCLSPAELCLPLPTNTGHAAAATEEQCAVQTLCCARGDAPAGMTVYAAPTDIRVAIGRLNAYLDRSRCAMRLPGALPRNSHGLLTRTDFPVVFRGERRSPAQVVMTGGFDQSYLFFGNRTLTDFEVRPLIVSARYAGAKAFISAHVGDEFHYVYALKSGGRPAVSLNENARFNGAQLARYLNLDERAFTDPSRGIDQAFEDAYAFDEVHIRGGFSTDEIYLIDTDDPRWVDRLHGGRHSDADVLGYPLARVHASATLAQVDNVQP